MALRPRHGLVLGLFAAGVALGLFAEWAALRRGAFEAAASSADIRLAAADLAVGIVLIGCGLGAWTWRPESWTGLLLAVSGFTWFLGTFADSGWPGYAAFGGVFVTLHRGPLIQALLAYPTGRVKRWLEVGAIGIAYASSVVADAGNSAGVTVALACLVFGVAAYRLAESAGPQRRARLVAFAAATAFSVVLFASGVSRLAGAAGSVDRGILWAYQVVLVLVAAALTLDLLLGRWTQATVTGLVVDLGELGESAPLRDRLAAALGDSSLEIGYRLPEREVYVDDLGRELELSRIGEDRTVTLVQESEEPVAALVHDASVLSDQQLVDSVAAAARIAVSNARLQAEVRLRLEEVEASRRRIVEAADAQRRRLEGELHEGAERRLSEVELLLGGLAPGSPDSAFAAMLAETQGELEQARQELGEFARGVHPRILTDGGLRAAIAELADRASVPVELSVVDGRFPEPLEVAAYFVCSEALANIGKYAEASRAAIEVGRREGRLVVLVRDDGRGGASVEAGSGLRGLADRVEAIGGRLRVESPLGKGTVLSAELPLT